MSEIEILLVELLNTNATTMIELFFGFISATSAYLVVSHIAAQELSTALVKVTVALYSVTAAVLIGGTQRQGMVLFGIREQMEKVPSLTWHPAVYEADWIFPTIIYGMPMVESLLFVSSVWYFFHARNTNERSA